MATIFKNWGNGVEGYRKFALQKSLMAGHFPEFRCAYSKRRLTCVGDVRPTPVCATYTVKIEYEPGKEPRVFILKPDIDLSAKIHIYSNGSLCLYHPIETPWKHTDNLHEKIVPWIHEWILFYELFLLEGKWLGKSAPHPMPRR